MKQKIFKESQLLHLRLDKIIYATEAGATAVTCLLVYIFAMDHLFDFLPDLFVSIIQIGAVLVCLFYTIYMGIGNSFRLSKIKKLENATQK